MTATVKAKKARKTAPIKPWLRLPAKPEATVEQTVRLYMDDQVADITDRVRDLSRDLGLDEAGSISIDVLDPVGDLADFELLDADEDKLLDGIDIRWGSVWWRIVRLERSDDGWTVIAEDRAAAYLRAHKRPMKASRNKMTRAAFVYQLVLSVKAGGGIVAYIPELRDKQKIKRAEVPESVVTAQKKTKVLQDEKGGAGWGAAGGKIKVKRVAASSKQLTCIDKVLTEASRLGASRRVLIACIMCITGESSAGVAVGGNSIAPDVRGPFQQRTYAQSGWTLSVSSALDPTASTKRFLLGGDRGAPGWKQKHGSLHAASGSLGAMINAVQIAGSAATSYYAGFEPEATKTVDAWLARNSKALSTSDTESTKVETYTQQFAFKTSDSDEDVNWWDATGQLADDVKWHRWAAGNTFGYASDDELIRGTPVLRLSRDMEEVKAMPWTWDVRREAAAVTVTLALEDEWQLLPGMVVLIDDESPIDGRWIVEKISDQPLTGGGLAEITLRRRNAKSLEPASVVVQREVKEKKESGVGGRSSYGRSDIPANVRAAYLEALKISQEGKPYGPAAHTGSWASSRAAPAQDCSSSTSLSLKAGGMMKGVSAPQVSDYFLNWGLPGKGKHLTVWVKPGVQDAGHVWMQYHDYERRFDTGGPGGGAGARIRDEKRDTAGFQPRHFPNT